MNLKWPAKKYNSSLRCGLFLLLASFLPVFVPVVHGQNMPLDDKARYEFADPTGAKGHHHHLVCRACGKIVDYKDFINEETELLRRAEEGLKKKYGFRIDSHVIQFYGLCPKCAR